MTYDKALELSRALLEGGFNHTIQVGIHPKLTQPVQARVDLAERSGGYCYDDLVVINDIAKGLGMRVRFGALFMSNGALAFETDE